VTPPPTPNPAPGNTPPTPNTSPGFTPPAQPGAKVPSSRAKKMIILGSIAGIVLVGFVLVPIIILQVNGPRIKPTPSAKVSITPRPSVDASVKKDFSQRFFFRKSGKVTAYDVSLTAPAAWEARFSTTPAGSYAWTDTFLLTAILSKYSALSSTNPNIPSTNYLALIDSTDWLGTDRGLIKLTPAQKQATVAALNTVTDASVGTAASAQNLLLASEPGGRQFLQPIVSADQSLKGISFLTLKSDGKYDPRQIIMLSGKLSGRSVILFGDYEVRDNPWAELSSLQGAREKNFGERQTQFINEFKAGRLSQDTLEIADELNLSLKSLKLTLAPGQ